MAKRRMGLAVAVAGALVLTVALAGTAPATGPTGLADGTETNDAYTMRLWGLDRIATSAAVAHLQLGNAGGNPPPPQTNLGTAGYPYTLGVRDGYYHGANTKGRIPGAIIVTAGDRFADALAGAALWQFPSGLSLTPVEGGGNALVDTTNAPIVLTASGREGAKDLSATAGRVADRYRTAGATSAIILGGKEAVPTEVEGKLKDKGYKVFRLGGSDRYDTARVVAMAAGVGAAGTDGTCATPDVDPANLEFWAGANQADCKVLDRTVFLADGTTGADALAVAPIAAWNHVPILLTAGSGLPVATAAALSSLKPDNIVVLGGPARIPSETASAAAYYAGSQAKVSRIAGADRYQTSVLIAEALAGIYPTAETPAVTFSNQTFCFARSEGTGDESKGWPDALTAGPACAQLSGGYDDSQPTRMAPPVDGEAHNTELQFLGGAAPRKITPLLLVASGDLGAVSGFLAGLFPSGAGYKTGEDALGTSNGGFGYLFGGAAAISTNLQAEMSRLLSGGTYSDALGVVGDRGPAMATNKVFFTKRPLLKGFVRPEPEPAAGEGRYVCAVRGSLADVRWLTIYDTNDATAGMKDSRAVSDLAMDSAGTVRDSGGYAGSPPVSLPICAGFTANEPQLGGGDDKIIFGVGQSLSGNLTGAIEFNYADNGFSATQETADGEVTSLPAGENPTTATGSDLHPTIEHPSDPQIMPPDSSFTIGDSPATYRIGITLSRPAAGIQSFTGTYHLYSVLPTDGRIDGTVTGEARLVGSIWYLDGMYTHTGSGTNVVSNGYAGISGNGGFQLVWDTKGTAADNTDDTVTANFDGLAVIP
ncbi:MAG: cell wall-binding repeat-containing protein [Actinomycetota bacterium]